MDFQWNEWNIDHVQKHGVSPEEAESVVSRAARPFPLAIGDDEWLAWGPGQGGRLIQVIFLKEEDDDVFIIHARPLNDREKKRYRRMRH